MRTHRPGGVFRRRIDLHAEERRVIAGVEDQFHHFEVELLHDGAHVTEVRGHALRTPWVTCPGAVDRLRLFVGQPLETRIVRRKDVTDPALHCTHLHDLTILAIARAARGEGVTRYDIAVPDRPDRTRFPTLANGIVTRPEGGPDGTTTPTLDRDGARILAWTIEGIVVREPEELRGLDYRKLGKWAEAKNDDALLEAVKVLRQGIFVSGGRALDHDAVPGAFSQRANVNACFAFDEARIDEGRREKGSERDFTDAPDLPLGDLVARWRLSSSGK